MTPACAAAIAALQLACAVPPPAASHWLLLMSDPATEMLYTLDQVGGKAWLPKVGRSPSWTPDGRIIYVRTVTNPPQIVIANADGSDPKQIGDAGRLGTDLNKPQLGANGTIAFYNSSGIWTMDETGANARLIVPQAIAPSLAISGAWLTYTKPEAGRLGVWRVNVDGTSPQRLTTPGSDPLYPDANAPSISRDETAVAIFAGVEALPNQPPWQWGHRNIAVMPAKAGVVHIITDCAPVRTQAEAQNLPPGKCITADNPAWSPDGLSLIYDRGSPNAADTGTYMINLDGTGNRRLSPNGRGGGAIPLKAMP